MAITIKPDSPLKVTTTEDKKTIQINKSENSVNLTTETTSVVNVTSRGPQGQKGDTGATGAQGVQGISAFSGSAESSSISTRITTAETELSNTLVSSSAQIASDISGSFISLSSSLSTRLTTDETNITNLQTDSGSFSTRLTTAEQELENTLVSSSAAIDHDQTTNFVANKHIDHSSVTLTAGDGLSGGGDITTNRSFSVDNTVLRTTGDNVISSSAQISSDISGSFTNASSSFSTRISTAETELSNTLISSSVQIASDISGSSNDLSSSLSTRLTTDETNITNLQTDSGSFSSRITTEETNVDNLQTDSGSFSTRITTAETELSNTLVSSSAQIASDISGSTTSLSSSFSSRVTTNETDISNLQTDSGSFSTRITTAETELSNTLISSSAQIATDISGSFTQPSASISTRLTTAESELSNTLISSSTQVDHDATTNFVSNEHIDHTSVSISAGDGLSGGGTIASNRTLAVDATVLRTTGDNIVSSSAQIASDISGSFTAGTGLDLSSGEFSVDVSDFMSNGSNNRILTATGTDGQNAEANFTIDGTSLQLGDGKILSLGNSDDLQIHHTTNQNIIELNVGNLTIRDESDNNIMRVNKDGGVDILEGNLTVAGNLDVQGTTTTIDSTEVSLGDRILTLNAGSAAGDGGLYVNDASTAETGSLLWDISEDRWIGGLKDSEVNLVTISSTDTLTNKTINASNNTLSNIGNSSLTNSSITVTDGSTSTATSLGDTITFSGTTNEIEVGESSGTITVGLPDNVTIGGNATVTGNLTVNGTTTTVNSTTIEITNSFTFEGSTADDYETVLGVIDPTADRTINLPNVSGTLPVLAAASTTQITATPEELNYVDGVTSNIQTQLDAKATNAFAIAQAVALG